MAKRCNVCNKPFKNAHGVTVHKMRSPACGGTTIWGLKRPPGLTPSGSKKSTARKSTRSRGSNGESGKEAIHEILANHPQGLGTAEIRTEMKTRGFNMNANYISQAASSDPALVRVERGRYRLKKNVARRTTQRSGASVVEEAQSGVEEAQSGLTLLPREALLLRIETLETQNRALHDAHLSLMRGIFV